MTQLEYLSEECETAPAIIVDTGIFCPKESLWAAAKKESLEQELERLRVLRTTFLTQGNWTTIDEVIKEFSSGNDVLYQLAYAPESLEKCKALRGLLQERTQVELLLKDDFRNLSKNITPEMESAIKRLDRLVRLNFAKNNGKTNEYETDIKLILSTLSLAATGTPAALYTRDVSMQATLIDSTAGFSLLYPKSKEIYLIDDEKSKAISSWEFNSYRRHLPMAS